MTRYNFLFLDMISALAALTPSDKEDPCIQFALAFRSAWSLSNYHQMFKLYSHAPKMTGYLIDWFAARERIQALKTIVKGYVSKFSKLQFRRCLCPTDMVVRLHASKDVCKVSVVLLSHCVFVCC